MFRIRPQNRPNTLWVYLSACIDCLCGSIQNLDIFHIFVGALLDCSYSSGPALHIYEISSCDGRRATLSLAGLLCGPLPLTV